MVRLLLEAKADPLHGQSVIDLVAKDETETGMLSAFVFQAHAPSCMFAHHSSNAYTGALARTRFLPAQYI